MKKTKHFNISVPELGDVPDITQVSNAISDLEDATAGALEIMKAEMQGTKITLTSVSRKTKRTGYYEGMSIRFKSPQDIEPNYLKTISVDELGDQALSVEYKVNRNEYIDIVYEENKFTAYPVVVQKTDSVSNDSSILVGTAKGVKTAYDKGVEALNKANQAQSSADKAQSTADGKVSKDGDTMTGPLYANGFFVKDGNVKGGIYYDSSGNRIIVNNTKGAAAISFFDDGTTKIAAKNLNTSSTEVVGAINELNSDKFSKNGGTIKGTTYISTSSGDQILLQNNGKNMARISSNSFDTFFKNETTGAYLQFNNEGNTYITGNNLKTNSKEVIGAINELAGGKENAFEKKSGFNLDKTDNAINDTNKLFTAKGAYDLKNEVDTKVSKSGDTMTGKLIVKSDINIIKKGTTEPGLIVYDESSNPKTSLFTASDNSTMVKNYDSGNYLKLGSNGNSYLKANNLKTKEKEVVGAINEMYDSAFISGDRVKSMNSASIGWNSQSGIYKVEEPGTTYTMVHFYSGDGSTPAFDLLGRYDGVLQYRTTRDYNGYSDWYTIATTKHCQEGYVSDIRFGASVSRIVYDGPAFTEQSGYVITELDNHNRDAYIDSLKARPLQKKKNDMWLTVSFEG